MKKALRHHLFNNGLLKVASLAFAGLLWFFVQGEQTLVLQKALEVTIKPPAGFVVRGDAQVTRYVTLQGPRAWMGELEDTELTTEIEFHEARAKTYDIQLTRKYLPTVDKRIRVQFQNPSIFVDLDRLERARVPVKEFLKGSPAEDYFVKSIKLEPMTIEVAGPRRDVRQISSLSTEPINIENLQQSRSFSKMQVVANSPYVSLEPAWVNVAVQIEQREINKRFSAIPILTEGSQHQVRVRPAKVTLVIQAKPGVLSFVDAGSDLEAFVDVRELAPGRYEKEIRVKIPPETVLIETIPKMTTVEVLEKIKTSDLQLEDSSS